MTLVIYQIYGPGPQIESDEFEYFCTTPKYHVKRKQDRTLLEDNTINCLPPF